MNNFEANLIKFNKIIKESNYSYTKVREQIFTALFKFNQPVSIKKIIKATSVDASSVYRNIQTLISLDVICQTSLGWKTFYELGEMFKPHHHHLTCVSCQKIININDFELEESLSLIYKKQGFKATGHYFELYGKCGECSGLILS